MENETKLSNQQLEALMRLLRKEGAAETDMDAFLKTHLTKPQAAAFSALLKNEALMKAMLSSPQAKAMLDELKKHGGPA